MKHIKFTEYQKNLLIELLNQRLKYYNDDNEFLYKKARKRLLSALNKICSGNVTTYSDWDKATFMSCINEHYEEFYTQLNLETAFSWLMVFQRQRELILKVDACKDILVNCGYYSKKPMLGRCDTEFRYEKILSAVDKMKKSDKIFLSRSGEHDYYKIAFVYNDEEYVPFELKNGVSPRKNFQFISLKGQDAEKYGKQYFSLVTAKSEAKELLTNCESSNYPEGVLEFMNHLLN